MSVQSEINRLQTAKADLKTAIENKGVTVPSSTKLDGYADLVDSIEQGDSDDRWYFVASEDSNLSTEDTYICFTFPLCKITDTNYSARIQFITNKAFNRYCWFEYKGEKYFVDNFNDGSHTLSKQGNPVECTIDDFMLLRINVSNGVYTALYYQD